MTTGEGGTTWFKDTGKGLGTENVTATEDLLDAEGYAAVVEAEEA